MAGHTPRVLLVEPDDAVGAALTAALEEAGLGCQRLATLAAARAELAARPYELVLSALVLPDGDATSLLDALDGQTALVVIGAADDARAAVEAMKAGAADYLLAPVDADELGHVLDKILRARAELPETTQTPPTDGLLGEAPAMMKVREQIGRAASTKATVLLRGETGTGKDRVARAIHEQSDRSAGPYVKVHCAALPESLLESELFGYEKGAFTGAAHRKLGRVELAAGGTLFLDEIGDITPATQVKLLRLLQDREYERLGGVETLRADVRVIAATHRDLEGLIKRDQFREDLFYRLNVLPIWQPPLRHRRSDIELLAQHFCAAFADENGKATRFDEAALGRLRKQRWAGNVRELQNFVERLVVLSDGEVIGIDEVEREDSDSKPFATETGRGSVLSTALSIIGTSMEPDAGVQPLSEAVQAAERKAIERALKHTKGNRKLAAKLLGVSRATLYNKLSELGIG